MGLWPIVWFDIVVIASLCFWVIVTKGWEVPLGWPSALYAPKIARFFAVLLRDAIGEEVLFRLLPIALVRQATPSRAWLLFTVFASSILFGYVHGSLSNILVQGTIGFAFAFVFLKCGGMNGRYLKALFWTSATHAMVNLIPL